MVRADIPDVCVGSTLHYSLKPKALSEGVPRALEVLLQAGLSLRDLRRTAVTLMVRADIPDVYRRTLLGQVQTGMSRRHVHPERKRGHPLVAAWRGRAVLQAGSLPR